MRTPYGRRRNATLRYYFGAALAAVTLATGCTSITGSPGIGGGGETGWRTHEVGETAGALDVELRDPASVAAAFVVASGSGGARGEGERRVRLLVTERFAHVMGRVPADGGTVMVEQVFVPDGVPPPTANQRYLTVTGYRDDQPLQVSLRLVRIDGRWLVDEVFLF